MHENNEIEVEKHSFIPYGFVSNISPLFINVSVFGATFSLPFVYSEEKITTSYPFLIHLETKFLENNSLCLFVYDEKIVKNKSDKIEKKVIFSVKIPKCQFNLFDNMNQLTRIVFHGLEINFKKEEKDINLNLILKSLKFVDYKGKTRLIESKSSTNDFINIKMLFKSLFSIECLQNVLISFEKSIVCYNNESLSRLFNIFNDLMKINTMIRLKEIKINPIHFIMNFNHKKESAAISLPSFACHNVNGSVSTLFTIIQNLYGINLRRFNGFCKI